VSLGRGLLVNADDFGFAPEVDAGIERCLDIGIVRSTSATMCFGREDAVRALAERRDDVSIGVHFNLSEGYPILDPQMVPTLVDPDTGGFLGAGVRSALLRRTASRREVRAELEAQVRALLDVGIRITHFDSHQNLHLYPVFFPAAVEVARATGIPACRCYRRRLLGFEGSRRRVLLRYYAKQPARLATHAGGRLRTRQAARSGLAMADVLLSPGYLDRGGKSEKQTWECLAHLSWDGIAEIYCHPSEPYRSPDPAKEPFVRSRVAELEILTDVRLHSHLCQAGVHLMSFHELLGEGR